jgi:DNA-binding winged helix-turn-helix (wHTH) protein/tetratricopeptide (TPR) repeat protein
MGQVTFGPFHLDLRSGQLRRAGVPVKLQPQPARLLSMLVSRPGELVTREEIRNQLWDADTFVDFDQSVNFCVRQIRSALRDDADLPCYLETVPRRGYRFIAPVQSPEPAATSTGVRETAAVPRQRISRWMSIAAVVLLGSLAVLTFRSVVRGAWNQSTSVSSPAAAGIRRAVDPHAREQLLLGRFFLNRATRHDVTKAIELFDAAIAADPEYAAAYAALADAYNSLGSVFVAGASPANTRLLALRAATRAAQLDPDLAEAYAASGYVALHLLDWAQAATALKQALRLNPDYAAAHGTYASYLVARGRPAEAVEEARRAVALDPVSLGARQTLAWMLYFSREYDAAIRELQTALQMDPSYTYGRWRLGQVEIVLRRFDAAVRDLERAAIDGQRAPAIIGLLAIAYAGQGRSADAQRILDEMKGRSGEETVPPGAIALAYIGVRDYANAIASLEQVVASHDNYAIFIVVDPLMDPLRSDSRFTALAERIDRGFGPIRASESREQVAHGR